MKVSSISLLLGVFVLAACQTATETKLAKMERAEDLLNAQGIWKLVEASDASIDDPLAQHLKARVKVDPNDTRRRRSYTGRGKPATGDTQRVLLLASASSDDMNAFMPAKTKPIVSEESFFKTHAVASADDSFSQEDIVAVKDIRIGEHPKKTRVVLDLDSETDFSYDFDDRKNLLYVSLPHAKWSAPGKKILDEHGILQAYMAKSYPQGGALLAFRLKKSARVVMAKLLEPDEKRGSRLVLDLVAL